MLWRPQWFTKKHILCTDSGMFSGVKSVPEISKLPERHDEHEDETLHWSLQGVVLLIILMTRENDVVSLRVSHYEDAVDNAKSHKILSQHSTMIDMRFRYFLDMRTRRWPTCKSLSPSVLLAWILCRRRGSRGHWTTWPAIQQSPRTDKNKISAPECTTVKFGCYKVL